MGWSEGQRGMSLPLPGRCQSVLPLKTKIGLTVALLEPALRVIDETLVWQGVCDRIMAAIYPQPSTDLRSRWNAVGLALWVPGPPYGVS